MLKVTDNSFVLE